MDFNTLLKERAKKTNAQQRGLHKRKHVLCSFSGGLDSTYMVYSFLQLGYDVDLVYTEILNNVDKTKREKEARAEIISYLETHRDVLHLVGEIRNKFDFQISVNANRDLSFNQVLPFLSGLASTTNSACHDAVALGYVIGDDAVSYLDDFKAIWKSFNRISSTLLPEMLFPLRKMSKNDIILGLPSALLERVTWCEYGEPNGDKSCGNCAACQRIERYERQLSCKGVYLKKPEDQTKSRDAEVVEVPIDSNLLIAG